MKPVDQVIVDDGRGDCLRACVCSMLELSIDEVPNFADCGFFDGLDKWGRERGLKFIRFSIPHEGDFTHKQLWFDTPLAGDESYYETMYMLAWGRSPRNKADGSPKQHAVVVESSGYGVKLAHDPHESRAGLLRYYGFGWLVKA